MFRRRHAGSTAEAATAWWPAEADVPPSGPPGADLPADDAPPLLAHDPFGGWPAYPDGGPGPVDPILGQHPAGGWRELDPAATAAGGTRSAAAGGTRSATAGGTRSAAADDLRLAAVVPDPELAELLEPDVDHPDSDWLPLLSHPVGSQPFQPGTEGTRPEPAEASSLAGAFAADYLSWDQENPHRRGQVLARYLPSDVLGDAALLGWSGRGRQRAEFALPGSVHPDGEGRMMVDVRVRVTPYRQVGDGGEPMPADELEITGEPAVAPAPTARGWRSLDSHWVRLTVPVAREQRRLVVDTRHEPGQR